MAEKDAAHAQIKSDDLFRKLGIDDASLNAAIAEFRQAMKRHGLLHVPGLLAVQMSNWVSLVTSVIMLEPENPEKAKNLMLAFLSDMAKATGFLVDKAVSINRDANLTAMAKAVGDDMRTVRSFTDGPKLGVQSHTVNSSITQFAATISRKQSEAQEAAENSLKTTKSKTPIAGNRRVRRASRSKRK